MQRFERGARLAVGDGVDEPEDPDVSPPAELPAHLLGPDASVPSVAAAYQTVVGRGLKPEQPKIGRDGKWQLNLYDPNSTRVELMEPKPVKTPCCSPIVE